MRTHGITGTYRAGCRCDDCKAAHAAKQRRRTRERVVDDEVKHGRYTTYVNYRCRCDACKRANREHMRVYRAGRAS